jgi:hypothetical protein
MDALHPTSDQFSTQQQQQQQQQSQQSISAPSKVKKKEIFLFRYIHNLIIILVPL